MRLTKSRCRYFGNGVWIDRSLKLFGRNDQARLSGC
ncbi:hypothetical protein RB2923 [Rhodopirellula baltica SH 1]|uniref:Uncharacterized protein n=1 Tax=Rhodopirellula baltica (strain DSM 10527 / NCIMB 13988 / SH1) TaxID=243090 RepID=Q7UV27_RHOBA|nr:hypothetical protein RB2923 [Rhodopirellula baltica SH 1]